MALLVAVDDKVVVFQHVCKLKQQMHRCQRNDDDDGAAERQMQLLIRLSPLLVFLMMMTTCFCWLVKGRGFALGGLISTKLHFRVHGQHRASHIASRRRLKCQVEVAVTVLSQIL